MLSSKSKMEPLDRFFDVMAFFFSLFYEELSAALVLLVSVSLAAMAWYCSL